MSIVHQCGTPSCQILTMGEFCVDHDQAAPQALLSEDLQVELAGLSGGSRPHRFASSESVAPQLVGQTSEDFDFCGDAA
jgi:hypothetical protein